MNTEIIERLKRFAEEISYPMIAFEAETGHVLDMNQGAKQMFHDHVEFVSIEPGDSLSKLNFWELLHKKKRLMRSHIWLKVDKRQCMVRGLINEMETEDGKLIYTLLFDMRSGVDVESLSLERIVYHAGIVAIDVRKEEDRFRVGYVSKNVDQYGYTQQQLYNQDITLDNVICEEDLERVSDVIDQAIENHQKEISVECRMLTAERDLIPVCLSRYHNFDEKGTLLGYELLITDIREELRRNKENMYLNNVVFKMKSVLIVKSYYQGKRVLKYISANGGMLGFNIDALKKGYKLTEDYIHPEDRDTVIDSVYQAVASGVTDYVQTFRMIRDDGTQIWVETEVRVNRISDGEAEISVLYTDITDIKKLEKELAEAVKGQKQATMGTSETLKTLPKLDKNDDMVMERFNAMAGDLCAHAGYYGVVLGLEGNILTTPQGPTEYMGQFYDLFERKEFKDRFVDASSRISQEKIPQSVTIPLNGKEVYMIFAPLIVEEMPLGYWVLASFAENAKDALGSVAELHWQIANGIVAYFYSGKVIEMERNSKLLAERRSHKLLQERDAVNDMLTSLIRNDENSINEILQKIGSFLAVSDVGLYLENKETKNVEKYFVQNISDEENSFGKMMELSVSEYHVLLEMFKKKPFYIINRESEEAFLREMLHKANMENMVLMQVATMSGRKGYIVFANAAKERMFEEKNIPFVSIATHILESSIVQDKVNPIREIIHEGILEVYDHLKDVVFVKEMTSGEIIFANKATDKLFGYSLVGKQLTDILTDREEQYRHMQGMRKRFIANKKVVKWQSYMKELDKTMNIVEVHMETSSGNNYNVYILKENKNE